MSIPTTVAKSPRRERQPPPVILPDELITEILSFLSVKALMRLRCLNKFWNTLISNDPTFVKTHLNRSKRNPYLSLLSEHGSINFRFLVFNPFPVRRLLDNNNPSITITLPDVPYHRLNNNKDWYDVIGCCNGLFCLLGYSSHYGDDQEFWLYFWNPATRTVSEKLGSFTFINHGWDPCSFSKFAFGYDISTDTHKVVAINIWGYEVKEVRIFSLGDNIWRNIQSFPVVPAPLTLDGNRVGNIDGVYLNGTLNWLAIRGYDITTVEQFVIISLDLGTETYLQLLPPRGFVEVLEINPNICVSMDCLCFCHDDLGNDLVIWKMTEFGVEESWTLFLKISYENLQMKYFDSPWMRLSENGNTLILTHTGEAHVVIYNLRDNRVERTVNIDEKWPFFVEDYVESLVSTC